MSGHSKWENIKRKKGTEDQKRGQIFSKITRAIVAAVKEGGSADPQTNSRLRMILQKGREANMPKDNIERALQKGEKQGEDLQGFMLEGYGPAGVAVMIEVLTDNHQRIIQEIKNIFQRHGGNMAEPGAVAFQFQKVGVIEAESVSEETILQLVDLGVTDFESRDGKTFLYMSVDKLEFLRQEIEKRGIVINSWDWIMKPQAMMSVPQDKINELAAFLAEIEDNEDVQRFFINCSAPVAQAVGE